MTSGLGTSWLGKLENFISLHSVYHSFWEEKDPLDQLLEKLTHSEVTSGNKLYWVLFTVLFKKSGKVPTTLKFCVPKSCPEVQMTKMSVTTDFEETVLTFYTLVIISDFFLLVHHCFSSLVHHPAEYLTCLTEEITVDQEMFGFVTVMVMLDRCAFSEWELRFR